MTRGREIRQPALLFHISYKQRKRNPPEGVILSGSILDRCRISDLVGKRADTLVISYAGESAVSGVSLVNQFNTIFIYIFTAILQPAFAAYRLGLRK